MKVNEMFNYMQHFYKMIHKDHPRTFLYCVICGISSGIIPYIYLYFSSIIIDCLLKNDISLAVYYVILLLSITLFLGCIYRITYQALTVIKAVAFYSVWKQTAYKAYILEYDEFEKTETMDKIRRAQNGSNGSGGVDRQIEATYELIQLGTSLLASILFTIQLLFKVNNNSNFLFYTITLTILFILFISLGILIQKKIAKLSNNMSHKNEHSNSLAEYFFTACMDLRNGKDIRLYKMTPMLLNFYKNICKIINHAFIDFACISSKYNALLMLVTQILAGCVYIYVGVSVLEGYISVGDILLYTGAITSMAINFNQFISKYHRVAYRFEYLGNYEKFINSKNMHYEGTLPIEKRDDCEYEFEFRHVSFKYPNTDNYILQDINLKFIVNQRFALVGRNGAGKTTLIKLLCRLYEPTKGEILLNGINIEKYDYFEYTQIFSVVFQEYQLFPLPLDQNIAGSVVVDENKCWNVLKQVGLKDKIMLWPQKNKTYLYKILRDGFNVSGGEAQKIAIARALYKDAPFIILDEPTAALDPIAESEIYKSFNQIMGNKTGIFISHRMSSCKFCDEIIVLDQGQIVQKGNHNELIIQKGLYQELWNAQAQYYTG